MTQFSWGRASLASTEQGVPLAETSLKSLNW
jgi:hypothetical protein